jgi:hypothetical protein
MKEETLYLGREKHIFVRRFPGFGTENFGARRSVLRQGHVDFDFLTLNFMISKDNLVVFTGRGLNLMKLNRKIFTRTMQ